MATHELTVPALAIRQSSERTLYSFAVDGKQLPTFAAVSRVQRDDRHELAGYQRAESIAHIKTIRKYLETRRRDPAERARRRVRLARALRARRRRRDGGRRPVGRLVIPIDDGQAEHEKPGWIVDGQQRSAAIRDADVDASRSTSPRSSPTAFSDLPVRLLVRVRIAQHRGGAGAGWAPDRPRGSSTTRDREQGAPRSPRAGRERVPEPRRHVGAAPAPRLSRRGAPGLATSTSRGTSRRA